MKRSNSISTFQSPLIMMSQNRQKERDDIAAASQAALDRELVQGLHAKLDAQAEQIDRMERLLTGARR